MTKKLGAAIKKARTDAGYTQEQLARKVKGVTASDISKYERGEAEPTATTVKTIAKTCGVTQKSLLDLMPASKTSTTTKKTTTTAKKTTTTAKKTTSTAKRTAMQVTATERKLVELYREATTDDKKDAIRVLKGENIALDEFGELIFGTKK